MLHRHGTQPTGEPPAATSRPRTAADRRPFAALRQRLSRTGSGYRLQAHQPSRGQSLVEFALVLPVFLVLLGTAIDAGRMFFSYVAITNGAREGAIWGGMHPDCATSSACPDPNNVTYRVTQETGTGVTVTVSCFAPDGTPRVTLSACTKGDTYRVRVERTFVLLTPLARAVVGSAITLGAQASAIVFNPAAYNSPTPTPTATPTPTPAPTPAPTPTPVASPTCTKPSGNFTSNPAPSSNGRVMVNVGQSVTFTGTSSPAPTSWLWTFGDGSTNTTSWPTVSHSWSSKGKFTVTLTLRTSDSDLTCATTITKTDYVQVN